MKAKRPTATHIMLRDYYEIFKEAFSDQTAFSDASDIAASSADPEMCLKHHFSAAMEAQAAWIEQQKHMQLHGKDKENQSTNVTNDNKEDVDPELVPVPQDASPAGLAWQMLKNHTATEDQMDFVALVVEPIQKAWLDKPLSEDKLSPVAAKHFVRLLGLGGGGCGKSWMLNKMIRPVIERFFDGHNAYLPLCATNAGARNIQGRTLHVATGLGATSSLKITALHVTHSERKKLECVCKNTACLALDEISQVGGPLFHATSLRFSFARETCHNLRLENYLQTCQTFGAIFAVILLGDFLQLPPVPEASSLLHPVGHANYEQQQARILLKSFPLVYQFTSAKRFTDPVLIEILACMREGRAMSDNAWNAFKQTRLQPGDPRLSQAGNFYECGYAWELVSLAQQLRPQASARANRKVLFYIQAIDRPLRRCTAEEHTELLKTASMSNTSKLMGLLPIHIGLRVRLTRKISAPQLVQEREGTVVGIEFRPADLQNKSLIAQAAKEHGHWVCKQLPHAVYVQIHDFTDEIFPPIPCKSHSVAGADRKCAACKFFPGVVAIRPCTAKWEATLKKEKLSVQRTQFALAPALVKTIHSVQGSTTEPGLIGHWKLPSKLGPSAAWLTRYVLLSRVRSLSALLSVGLPTRAEMEAGPPADLRDRLNDLFEHKIASTYKAAAAARAALCWPARPDE